MNPAGHDGAPDDIATERLFVAFWPEATLRARIESLATAAARKARARPVPGDNLHVTLVFVGKWPVKAREQIERVVDALDIPGGELVFTRLAYWRRAGVVTLVADEPPRLVAAYQRDLGAGIAALGWTPETRPWRPHVTLGRKAGTSVRKTLEEPVVWPCSRVALVRSENDGSGSVYRPLRVWER